MQSRLERAVSAVLVAESTVPASEPSTLVFPVENEADCVIVLVSVASVSRGTRLSMVVSVVLRAGGVTASTFAPLMSPLAVENLLPTCISCRAADSAAFSGILERAVLVVLTARLTISVSEPSDLAFPLVCGPCVVVKVMVKVLRGSFIVMTVVPKGGEVTAVTLDGLVRLPTAEDSLSDRILCRATSLAAFFPAPFCWSFLSAMSFFFSAVSCFFFFFLAMSSFISSSEITSTTS